MGKFYPFSTMEAGVDQLPLLNTPSYKWIFVGGKGGVGKTTTSCAIASALTHYRKRVLLVSTDPASNIGDTFQQHFTYEPQLVNGYPNLWAMESPEIPEKSASSGLESLMAMPGVDEMQVLSSLFDSIEKDEFDIVVFDTAPTGHTMRLLQLPQNAQSIIGGLGIFSPNIMNTFSQFLGDQSDDFIPKTERFQNLLKNAAARLANQLECTFVCVLLPEFLPLYETERLIEFLVDKKIDTHLMVINQVIDGEKTKNCPFCSKRSEMQQKYLKDIRDLYGEEFKIVEIPMLESEVKGSESVRKFSNLLSPLFSKE
ncbi:ATPase GET3 [Histomonas meleagridis]|uniref:ATPase GET3 n=1 Tax=Histomonas meleagridis TaxID=135588 RepID=UPI003559F638|nr:ATPase GET3 [Histomonas meleagridis]KAH0800715.1 ATPase GET3 [Histomonas meleagridis]